MTELNASLEPRIRANGLYAEVTGDVTGPLTNAGRLSLPDISGSALAYQGVSKMAIIVSNYEADVGHFPLLFRTDRDHRSRFQGRDAPADQIESHLGEIPIDGLLTWCNRVGKGVCAENPFEGFQREWTFVSPQEARWFVRTGGRP